MSGAVLIAAVLVTGVYGAGCASPEQRYRTLSFFFDGVPDPNAPESVVEETVLSAEDGTVEEAPVEEVLTGSTHDPWAQNKCELCHDFRNMSTESFLVTKKVKLCARCHTGEEFDGAFVHGPVASGQCYGCHHPHRSEFPKLLLKEGSEICAECHNPETFQTIEQHRTDKGEDCLSCHLPHVADKKYMLK